MATLLTMAVTLIFPYTPLGALFDFQVLPVKFLLLVGGILVVYMTSAEVAKRFFYRWAKF